MSRGYSLTYNIHADSSNLRTPHRGFIVKLAYDFLKFPHLTILKAESKTIQSWLLLLHVLLLLLLLLPLPLSTFTLLPAEQLLLIAAAATTDSIYSACVFLVALNSAQSHV